MTPVPAARSLPRFILVLVFTSVAVNVAVAGGFVVLSYGTSAHNAAVSRAQHAAQVTSCVAGNKTRARTGEILGEVIALLPPGNTAQVTRLRADVAANYRLTDCAALYGGS